MSFDIRWDSTEILMHFLNACASSRLQLRAIIQHSLEFNPGHLIHYLPSNRVFGLYGNKHTAGNIYTHLQMDHYSQLPNVG